MKTVALIGVGLFWLASSAQAASSMPEQSPSPAQAYQYGMKLDVAKVLDIEEPITMRCKVITARMTYENSAGQVEQLEYLKMSEACSYQS